MKRYGATKNEIKAYEQRNKIRYGATDNEIKAYDIGYWQDSSKEASLKVHYA